jgi:hypothetical protein
MDCLILKFHTIALDILQAPYQAPSTRLVENLTASSSRASSGENMPREICLCREHASGDGRAYQGYHSSQSVPPNTNTFCLTSQHIISVKLLLEGHPVRCILAKFSVQGYLRHVHDACHYRNLQRYGCRCVQQSS